MNKELDVLEKVHSLISFKAWAPTVQHLYCSTCALVVDNCTVVGTSDDQINTFKVKAGVSSKQAMNTLLLLFLQYKSSMASKREGYSRVYNDS